jgi:putative addiction module component (TIGR02574 family)
LDISVTLNKIKALSIADRIKIVQEILESIAAEQTYPDLTAAQKQELDRRITDYESNPDDVMTWKEIKTSITGKQ